jgi:ATP-binding cassette subfamily B protein
LRIGRISVIDLVFPDYYQQSFAGISFPMTRIYVMLFIAGAVLLLVIYGVRFFFSYIIGYWGHVMGIRIETDMRSDLFENFKS